MDHSVDVSSAKKVSICDLTDGVSIIVPVFNKEADLSKTLESILAAKTGDRQLILIDDCSTDGSPEIIKAYCDRFPEISSIRLKANRGAGVARNAGIPLIRHTHVIFFDADDLLKPESMDNWHAHACAHDSDVAMCQYNYVHNGNKLFTGMHKRDKRVWERSIPSKTPEITSLTKNPDLLEFTNYPWNKMYKSQFLIEKGILFSATPVHNDIFFHWVSLCAAESILLIPEAYCTHFVATGASQITEDFSRRRLSIFDALNDVEHFFSLDLPAKRNFYANFLRFKIDLIRWAGGRMPDELAPEFEEAVRDHYSQTVMGLALLDFEKMPDEVSLSILAAHNPRALIKG